MAGARRIWIGRRGQMFIEPPTPIFPSIGRFSFSATGVAAICANQEFRADGQFLPGHAIHTGRGDISASCTWDLYSVLILARVPRLQAVLNRIGSMNVCGKSFMKLGEDSKCSALDSGCVPHDFMRPISSPARLSQKTFSPMML